MNLDKDLERIALQEARLQFRSFDAHSAWVLGSRLRALAEQRNLAITIEIQVNGNPLFLSAMPGTAPNNLDWARRKKNVVTLMRRSSYAVGLQLQKDGTSLIEQAGLELRDYAAHGGCFPILLRGTGCIGTVAVSGLPQRDDHELIVEALAGMLEERLEELALDSLA
ncbi:heme-degrading domain-containing protein [Azotobacter vinelandii]|uniref:heme-degrading domain-containing protein n=1 Tax=Azotobacter vinelandii TaxID=354 RepID=UPI0026667896|nr:heme-degrading domain-containing protein [Azotobacter vinelandii]WKN20078.1 heme-degrading domain-containing protein [Azotobacter vinelandii]